MPSPLVSSWQQPLTAHARPHLREEVRRAPEVTDDAPAHPDVGRHKLRLLVSDAHALQLQVQQRAVGLLAVVFQVRQVCVLNGV